MEPDNIFLSCESYRWYLDLLRDQKRDELTRLRVRQGILEEAIRENAVHDRIEVCERVVKMYIDRLWVNNYLEGVLRRAMSLAHQTHTE